MHLAADLLDQYQLHATPLAGTTAVAWRSLESGCLVAVTDAAPHGRKGLWDAMARAAATHQTVVSLPTDVAPAVEPAHLAYLARLVDPDERTDATGSVAPVVSISRYRAA
jgi:hypothetical protein